jgi:hypothetical protein
MGHKSYEFLNEESADLTQKSKLMHSKLSLRV